MEIIPSENGKENAFFEPVTDKAKAKKVEIISSPNRGTRSLIHFYVLATVVIGGRRIKRA